MRVSLGEGDNVQLSTDAPDLTVVAVRLGWYVHTTTGADDDPDASAPLCDVSENMSIGARTVATVGHVVTHQRARGAPSAVTTAGLRPRARR